MLAVESDSLYCFAFIVLVGAGENCFLHMCIDTLPLPRVSMICGTGPAKINHRSAEYVFANILVVIVVSHCCKLQKKVH